MTNLILPRRRKLIIPSFAAGLAAASPAMGHNGGPPITDAEVSQVVEQAKGAGIALPWGTLPSDPTLAMFMMAKMAGVSFQQAGGEGGPPLPQNVYSSTLWTADNVGPRTINTGLNMSTIGGMSWLTIRNETVSKRIFDTDRTAGYALYTNNNSSHDNLNYDFTGFATSGFTLPSGSIYNGSGYNSVAWNFVKAAKFFDMTTFVAGSATNRRIAHNLGVAPGFFVMKRYTTSAESWRCYHVFRGRNYVYNMEETSQPINIPNIWGSSDPTSTDIGIDESTICTSGQSYVVYFFAHDTTSSGIIQCGTYFGSASTSGPTVTLGWRPQWLLVKKSSATGNWTVYDNQRSTTNPRASVIFTNLTTGDGNADQSPELDFTSTGFQPKANGVTNATADYIYMAIREPI